MELSTSYSKEHPSGTLKHLQVKNAFVMPNPSVKKRSMKGYHHNLSYKNTSSQTPYYIEKTGQQLPKEVLYSKPQGKIYLLPKSLTQIEKLYEPSVKPHANTH